MRCLPAGGSEGIPEEITGERHRDLPEGAGSEVLV